MAICWLVCYPAPLAQRGHGVETTDATADGTMSAHENHSIVLLQLAQPIRWHQQRCQAVTEALGCAHQASSLTGTTSRNVAAESSRRALPSSS